MNNKGCFGIGSVGLIIIGVLAVLGFWGIGKYNRLVTENNEVLSKWSNVETEFTKYGKVLCKV